jgi:hypothetical protein
MASRYLLAMPSRQPRSHAGFTACAFTLGAAAANIMAHAVAQIAAEITNDRAASHRLLFNFIPLSEILA